MPAMPPASQCAAAYWHSTPPALTAASLPPLPPPLHPSSFLKLLRSGTDPRLYGGSLYFSYGGDCTLSQQRWVAMGVG